MKDNVPELFGKMLMALEMVENCKELIWFIPEVRTNLVYAKSHPKSPADVIAIEGRITIRNGLPFAAGKPKFGASSHMARFIIELNKAEATIRSGINFVSSPEIEQFLVEYCQEKDWALSIVNRGNEPDSAKEKEGASMSWKVAEGIRTSGGKPFKIYCENGAIGKEDVGVIVGADPIQVVNEFIELVKSFLAKKQSLPKIGKLDLTEFETFILKRLGKPDNSILVPPLTGVDAGVIDIGNNQVLIVAEDPIFQVPKQSPEMFGWYTVHIGASDVAVMGVKPKYLTYTLLMPPNTSAQEFEIIVDSIHRAALELEISIIGGHTGYYPVGASPLIGGITVFAIADKTKYITPAGAQPNDAVILTKGPAIEAAALLAGLYESELSKKYDRSLVNQAKSLCNQITVVKDALTAMEAGGVTAMHDATEGGVLGGLFEVANASKVGMELDETLIIYPEEVQMVCEFLSLDPLTAISEGSLIITAAPEAVKNIIHRLNAVGIQSSIIGKVVSDTKKRIIKRRNGNIIPLEIQSDPFWPAFFKGI